jgi:glycerol uptake facilitator-like aquaporin
VSLHIIFYNQYKYVKCKTRAWAWGSIVVRLHNLVAMVTMEHNLNPQFSMAHITNLKLNNFKVIEDIN